MNQNDIQTGDTLLIRNKKDFISRTICAVMKKWGTKKGLPTDKIYSHAGRFVWIAGKLYVYGSIDSGYKPWLFDLHYKWDDDLMVMRRKTPLSLPEMDQTTNFCLHLVTISRMYQYLNFIKWLTLVYLGLNIFGKENDHVMYCYESEHLCRKNLNPDNYGDISQTDIFQLVYDPNYEIIWTNQ
jgi:hypothetical protein